MAVTPSLIQECLGEAYEPEADYLLETAHCAMSRIMTDCDMVGQIETIGDGTMVILKRKTERSPE